MVIIHLILLRFLISVPGANITYLLLIFIIPRPIRTIPNESTTKSALAVNEVIAKKATIKVKKSFS